MAAAAHFLIRKKLFNTKYPQSLVAKDFAVAEKKLHLAVSRRKYDPGKKASKRKCTSDVKAADPKPSTSQDQPQDQSTPKKQPQDESISEQQPQDESISEQPQGTSTAAQQPQGKVTDTLSSQSSDFGNAIILCYLEPENCQNPTTKDTNFGKLHSLTPSKMPTNRESIHFSRTSHHI